MRKLMLVALAALAFPATAPAGGWATAGISPLPGDDVAAGEEQLYTVTVLRHGQTPEDGAEPLIVLTNPTTGETKTFAAQPAGKVGVYEASVTWPAGTWKLAVNDGLEATGYGASTVHTFGTVAVGGGSGTGGGGGDAVWTITGSIALALALAALLMLGLRRRPRTPTAATAPR